jgi:hypothetical protein
MKKIYVLLFVVFLSLPAFAANRIYYDNVKNIEVVDVSNAKTLTQINAEFGGNFIDVTMDRAEALAAQVASQATAKQTEQLIQNKMRELAISALQSDGSLDSNGVITDAGKTAVTKGVSK